MTDRRTDGQTDRQTSTAIARSNRVRCALVMMMAMTMMAIILIFQATHKTVVLF